MKKEMIEARLVDNNVLEVSIHKDYDSNLKKRFFLYENGEFIKELNIRSYSQTNHHNRFLLDGLPALVLGHEYEIQDDKCIFAYIDYTILGKGEEIKKFCTNEELGAIYTFKHTIFKVFAPIATEVYVQLFSKKGKEVYLMKRNDKTGIYTYDAIGDYDGFEYTYLLKISGNYVEAVDPYAKSLTINSKRGVVVDVDKEKVEFNDDKLPPFEDEVQAIIYELSVRDFTSSLHTNIINKGKFLGMCEKNKVSEGNNPVGVDYLKYLGVSHVQLLPVTDFVTTNELFPEKTYNWGYDPNIMFSLEGSYASLIKDPYSRIKEFKELVSTMHESGIRVIMDMVFNHQFLKETSSFDKIVPNYYYRFYKDGAISNGSFCGNELESRNAMVKKYIVDCCKQYVRDFHVDGFRFDLMGLTDIDTINEVYKECKAIRKDFMLYGEGWDMPSAIESENKTILKNAHGLDHIGFFNDRYRDHVKGKSSDHELGYRGYLLGDTNYFDIFIHCFLSSSLPISLPPLFLRPGQSINYIECHDNATLYDKLLISNGFENESERLKRISLLNAGLIFSHGVCFLHQGQEVALSKKGIYNSYNSGDEINSFDTEVFDERFKMARFVAEAIALKKELDFINYKTADEIKNNISYENYYGRAIFTYRNLTKYQEIKIIINPINEAIQVSLDGYYRIVFNEYGRINQDFYAQNVMINGISLLVLIKE